MLQPLTSWDVDTPEWEKQGASPDPRRLLDSVAHLPEGHSEGAGLAGAGLPGGVMLQDDAIALQYHQRLPVQGQGAGLRLLGHCEAQLSSIGGHLGRGNRRSARVPAVGPCYCSRLPLLPHLFSKGTTALLLPSCCLCGFCSLEFPFFPHPLPYLVSQETRREDPEVGSR